jgi:hypothetical protein
MSGSGNSDRLPKPPPLPTTLERRLRADEVRLARDEALIAADEARLLEDEQRLAADERDTRLARRLSATSAGLAAALVIAVAGLVIGVIALREDVDAISSSAGENSVGTGAIRDSAVTAGKLADGSVTGAAVAAGAIRGSELGANAVTTGAVRRDSLTGADVRESTLGTVPSARESQQAADSTRLDGRLPAAYLSGVETVEASTPMDTGATKGPLAARCPDGTRVISGGAAVEGFLREVALVSSAPDGRGAWAAIANGPRDATEPWRLIVTAVCAAGGR